MSSNRSTRLPVISDTQPDGHVSVTELTLGKDVQLVEMLDVEVFRDVCASFVELYKIGIKIYDSKGAKLVDLKVGNTDWCNYIFHNPEGRRRCTELVGHLKTHHYEELRDEKVVEQTCFSGLKYVVIPVGYGGELLGRIIYGPFLPTELQRPGEEVYAFDDGFEPDRLWQQRTKIRRASPDAVRKIVENLCSVVESISFVGIKALMTQRLHVESITSSYNELATTNRSLQQSLERLKELDRVKSNFLAMISHELRTPLTSVIGYSEMLLEGMAGSMTSEQSNYIETIKEKGESLLEMIGTLLDLSRIESGKLGLHFTATNIAELLRVANTNIVPQAQKKAIVLELKIDPNLPCVHADPDRLCQAVVNLLGNAVKFTPKGGSIRVSAQRWVGPRREGHVEDERFGPPDEEFVRIEVADTGIGIPTDKLEQIFENFYQVDNSITREYGGTGLGLAIVKRFVEAHQGEVWVDSVENRGTTFSLLIPTNMAQPANEDFPAAMKTGVRG